MRPSPWIMSFVLSAFAAMLYYGVAANWWMPRMICG